MRIPFLYILISLLLLSCKKDTVEYHNDFYRSFETFQQFKKESNNSYVYKTTTSSWTGYTTEYTFEVVNGVVRSRSFAYTKIGNIKRPDSGWTREIASAAFQSIGYTSQEIERLFNEHDYFSVLEWKEMQQELGIKHELNNIWTLDEIYNKAKTEWLIDRPNTNIYFEAKNDGLISNCGYVDQNCQDDCFVGITINSISPLKQ